MSVRRLRPEERCAVLEVTQDELVMLAENEWRLHGNDEAGGGQQWHMPRQTLDMVRQPSFCRGNTNDHSRTLGPNSVPPRSPQIISTNLCLENRCSEPVPGRD